ncbi:MAG TPA: DUF5985 family protein [Kofleriaceae bacterium]|nr:DUF5985 family protein [Kofleriaceae bacterium]
MPEAVYSLCFLTSLLCAVLLVRSYLRSRTKLLLWSSVCFVGLAVNNLFLVLDRMVFLDVDLALPRQASALVALLVLIFGLIHEVR